MFQKGRKAPPPEFPTPLLPLWAAFLELDGYRPQGMVGVCLIPLETLHRYNDTFLMAWGYYEFSLLVALDRKAVEVASSKSKSLASAHEKEREVIPITNAVAIRELFRSIGAKKNAQKAAKELK